MISRTMLVELARLFGCLALFACEIGDGGQLAFRQTGQSCPQIKTRYGEQRCGIFQARCGHFVDAKTDDFHNVVQRPRKLLANATAGLDLPHEAIGTRIRAHGTHTWNCA